MAFFCFIMSIMCWTAALLASEEPELDYVAAWVSILGKTEVSGEALMDGLEPNVPVDCDACAPFNLAKTL